jgi:hypothetical protein
MINPQYPPHQFRIRQESERSVVFDECRKLWVKLTPEEWVRQNFIQWLVQVMNYPSAFIAVEKEIHVHELSKRFDILVYDRKHLPWMMVECKAQSVPLTEKVLMQVLRYNIAVPVPFLVITNGVDCRVVQKIGKEIRWMEDYPEFPPL